MNKEVEANIDVLTRQTIQLLTNNYLYKTAEQQIMCCQYLFMVSNIIKGSGFDALAVDLLLEILKSTYTQTELKKNKKIENLIELAIYISLISKSEEIDIDIDEVYKAINERIQRSTSEEDRYTALLYNVIFTAWSSVDFNTKNLSSIIETELLSFSIINKSVTTIFLFACAVFFTSEINNRIRKSYILEYNEVESLMLKTQDVNNKILLLFSCWLIDKNAARQLLKKVKILKRDQAKFFYLYDYLRQTDSRRAVPVYSRISEKLKISSFEEGIVQVLKHKKSDFNINSIVISTLCLVIFQKNKN